MVFPPQKNVYTSWWFQTILKNISQWERLSHILWKIKHVPNHQPDNDSPKNIQDHPRPLNPQ
jgi:hypothetical protein